MYPELRKENRRMSTCNRLDLQTLGSQPVMPKKSPGSLLQPQPRQFIHQHITRTSSFMKAKGFVHHMNQEGHGHLFLI